MLKQKTHSKRKKFAAKRICLLCKKGQFYIDYKDVTLLKRYLKTNNKISSSKITGNCGSHQRQISNAIKRARIVALLPFVAE
ncbi:small subunit ribosomal protein S18 [Mycoplasmoides fastidiosum]|uniref:Small ribosomal subunit protein bS18 n=1 Tax=Mycoplasmoides fastidiosum TaxID=92758 RepID=A0ABU0M048_9BACT|nr:30S ribosomal protein S18 [Mycoplasmoides fastidiosum]MDQ0514215.1 small subunit ribosomal protein S18 [Mycoplasmoides fastidiosum]UUD37376.1 30S ribosomal protein S18 [Mycoplasmoides fastidiosum]